MTGGLALAVLLVISLLPAPDARGVMRQTKPRSLEYQATDSFSVSATRRRVALIGFDGIDPLLLDVFIAGGYMPTFARLKQEASYSKLTTSPEGLSPPIWTTFATGVGPAKHGIHDFFVRRLIFTRLDLSMLKNQPSGFATSTLLGTIIRSPLVDEQPITPAHRNAPTLWGLAGKAGLSSCVIDWMGTWPAESLNGAMISDRAFFARNQGDLAVVTDDITGTKLPLRLMARQQLASPDAEQELCSPTPGCLDFLPSIAAAEQVDVHNTGDFHVAENDFYLRTAERMLDSEDCRDADLVVFYSHLPDFLNHILSPDELDHLYAGLYSGELETLSLHVYKEVDRTLGRLLELLGREPAVLVFSDHGVEIVGEGPTRKVSHFRGPPGVFFSRASRGQPPASLTTIPNIYEIAPTALALLGLPLPDFLDGGVIEDVAIAELGNSAPIRTIAMKLERDSTAVGESRGSHRIDATARERLRALGYVE